MYRDKINQLLADYRLADSQHKEERSAYVEADGNLTIAEESQQILQYVALTVQQEAHSRISSVVTRCLEEVFDDPYEFKIEFERKRGRTEANLTFTRSGLVLTDPINECGGGVIDVAAFALRLACLVLERPIRRRVLVLDEPFTKVRGMQNRQRMRGLIEMLAKDFDVQFILCIDIDQYPTFALGNIIEVG